MATTTYCGLCGEPLIGSEGSASDHAACHEKLRWEPPRFCAHCRRRMKVQVSPRGWTAACVEHGVVSG